MVVWSEFLAHHENRRITRVGFGSKSTDVRMTILEKLNMETFEFQLDLADKAEMSEEMAERLFEAGCDDATPFSSGGVASLGFSREANTLKEAIQSAIADVHEAGYRVSRLDVKLEGHELFT